jgi:hypothetical protein
MSNVIEFAPRRQKVLEDNNWRVRARNAIQRALEELEPYAKINEATRRAYNAVLVELEAINQEISGG